MRLNNRAVFITDADRLSGQTLMDQAAKKANNRLKKFPYRTRGDPCRRRPSGMLHRIR